MLYETKWEILPIDIQKVIMLLIHRKQNERGLSLGPFGAGINGETIKLVRNLRFNASIEFQKIFSSFFQATNKIYTFVMFLRRFFE